uniref:PIH1 domain containing 1 n=1 Tax=Strigops habroptila TaxID=2489341 RepID=A0A672TXL7_STRHB
MADPSLLSAGLEAPDAADEALRRLLLQVGPGGGRAPPGGGPGLCVKTRAGGAKVFLNVCHSREVPPPPPLSPPGLWRLLHGPALGEPHAELDQGGRGCTAYDVVVNSGFFRTLQADPLYLEFFLTVAMEGLSEKYGVELELTDWRVLQNRKFMGSISAQNIRARPRPHIQEWGGCGALGGCSDHAPPFGPAQEGAVSLQLGLNQERLVLGGAGGGPPLLQLGLPLPPDPPRCRARFHRGTKLPLSPPIAPHRPYPPL